MPRGLSRRVRRRGWYGPDYCLNWDPSALGALAAMVTERQPSLSSKQPQRAFIVRPKGDAVLTLDLPAHIGPAARAGKHIVG